MINIEPKMEKENTPQLFQLQVSGIRCTNCAKKITSRFSNRPGIKKISVNVLTETVLVSLLQSTFPLKQIKEELEELKFKIMKEPEEVSLENSPNKRVCTLKLKPIELPSKDDKPLLSQNYEKPQILEEISKITGITFFQAQESEENFTILKIEYNPFVLKGSQILEEVQANCCNIFHVEVIDKHLDQFRKKTKKVKLVRKRDLVIALLLIFFFMIMVIVLPRFNFFEQVYIFPFSWDIASIYLLFMLSMTIFTFHFFGRKSFNSAYENFKKHRILNMETLISIGSISSFVMGIFLMVMYIVENSQNEELQETREPTREQEMDRKMQIEMIVHMFEGASQILIIVVIGKFLEGQAKSTIIRMTKELFPENQLVKNQFVRLLEMKNRNFVVQNEKEVEISLVEKDDLIKIQPGDKLLVDGVILHLLNNNNLKAIDSVCYGWDTPFSVKIGDRLKSGASIAQGEAILQVESTIENSMLYKISNQLNMAQNDQESSESGIQGLFKVLSDYFVKVILVVAFVVLVTWLVLIWREAVDIDRHCVYCEPFLRCISVLVASCPCALGLAIPSVITISLNLAMKNNILIKKNGIFEKIEKVQSVIFDKTGTLFTTVDEISHFRVANEGYTQEEIWEMVSVVEKQSRHPVAELLYKESIRYLKSSVNLSFLVQELQFQKNGPKGILKKKGDSEQKLEFVLGNRALLEDNQVVFDKESEEYLQKQSKNGFTCLNLAINKKIIFQIALNNTANLRQEAPAVIQYLQKRLKKSVFILSGDAKETVERVGQVLNIPKENVIGETDSEQKKALIKKLKEDTKREVMMIGDGLNDILSIQEAGIGVTINAKSEMNLIASDVVALNENLWKIVSLFKLIRVSKVFIWMNLLWASAYNIVILPIAAGVFYGQGISISPTVASIAMSGSSLVVIGFSNLMRAVQFDLSKSGVGKRYMDRYKIGKFQDESCRKQELINQFCENGKEMVL